MYKKNRKDSLEFYRSISVKYGSIEIDQKDLENIDQH